MADPQSALLVRIQAPGGRDVLVVPCPPDLRFAKEWPGGHKDASCTLAFPPGQVAPAALVKLARVSVVDRRTGRVVWAGRLTDPGMTETLDGLSYALTAEGHQAEADGWREVYAVIDRAQESWQAVGEFSPAQGSFSGDLTPGLDFELDPIDFGDLVDFGDDLAIDFDGNLDFGGDLGDFGNIDFGGVDYPSNADYPGYLGFLQDPDGAFGDMLPIPLGGPGLDGSWWADWEPGFTEPAATATGTTVGVLTVSPTGGGISRHKKIAYGGLTIQGGWAATVTATTRLGSSSSLLRIWGYADPSLMYQGYYLDVTTSAMSLYLVLGGTATQVATTSVSWTPGVTRQIEFTLQTDILFGLYDLQGRIVVPGGAVEAELNYFTPTAAREQFGDDSLWGVAAAGAANTTIEFDSVVYGPFD